MGNCCEEAVTFCDAVVAWDAALLCKSLYKNLSGERSPSFDTILKVICALGLKLNATAHQSLVLHSGSRSTKQRAA